MKGLIAVAAVTSASLLLSHFSQIAVSDPGAQILSSCRDVQVFNPYWDLVAQKPEGESPLREWSIYDARISEALQKGAEILIALYEKGEWKIELARNYSECLKSFPEKTRWRAIVYHKLREYAVELLHRHPFLKDFVTDGKSANGVSIEIFTELGENPTDKPEGFHRNRAILFLDINRISPQELPVYFIHGLAHALDEKIQEAKKVFSEEKRFLEHQGPGSLSASLEQSLERWLRSGLDLGFLGEYRAWVITLFFYREGRDRGIWPAIPRFEAMLPSLEARDLRLLVLHFLHPSFEDPVYKQPFVNAKLREIRAKIIEDPNPPPLGNLAKYLSAGMQD